MGTGNSGGAGMNGARRKQECRGRALGPRILLRTWPAVQGPAREIPLPLAARQSRRAPAGRADGLGLRELKPALRERPGAAWRVAR